MAPRLTDDQGTGSQAAIWWTQLHSFISHMTGRNECNTPEMLSWVGGRSQCAIKDGENRWNLSLKLLQI